MNIETLTAEQKLPTRDYNHASVAVLVERTDTPGEFHVATATIHYGAGRAIPDGSVIVKAANMLSARSIAIDGTRWRRTDTVLRAKDCEVHIYRPRG